MSGKAFGNTKKPVSYNNKLGSYNHKINVMGNYNTPKNKLGNYNGVTTSKSC